MLQYLVIRAASPRTFNLAAHCAAALAVTAAVLLSAGCGGGGGGSSPPPPPAHILQLDKTQITLAAPSTVAITPTDMLSGTVSGNPAAVYATVLYTNNGIASISTPSVQGATATALIQGHPSTTLAPGTYHDTITVSACPDAACATQFQGSPATVNVTYIVGLDVSPSAINAQAIEGAAPPDVPVNLTYYAGAGTWTTSTTYTSGANWLVAPAAGNALPATFGVAMMPLSPGTYGANLAITASGAQTEVRTIPVTYQVAPLLRAATVTDFSVTNQQAAAGQVRSAAVSSADTTRNTGWTAAVDAASSWLEAATNSGDTSGSSTLQLQLVPAEVAKLRNGRYVATVTIVPSSPGLSSITLPVGISLDRTQVSTVAPYVGASGLQQEVIIRGSRLDEGAIQAVRFGNNDALGFTLDNATRLRATHGPLAAGRYPINVQIGGNVVDLSAELVVQDPGNYAAAGDGSVPITFGYNAREFDPERRSCYLASATQVAAVRAAATSWSSQVSSVTFTSIRGMALGADGRELLVVDGSDMVHLDPVTLQETARRHLTSTTGPTYLPGLARVDDGRVAFAADGLAWNYTPWTRSDAQGISVAPVVQQLMANVTGNMIVQAAASNLSMFTIQDSATLAARFSYTGGSTETFVSDRFGARWAFGYLSNTRDVIITDGSGTEIGRVPSFDPITITPYAPDALLMSDDGKTLIVATFPNIYRVFDLSPLDSGGSPVLAATLSNATDGTSSTYVRLTPAGDEVVSCGVNTVNARATH
jgi:hypothetical protein